MPPGDGDSLGPLRDAFREFSLRGLAADYYNVRLREVDIRGLAELLAGSLFVAVGLGYARLITALSEGVQMLFGGVVGFLGLGQTTVVRGLSRIGRSIAGAASNLGDIGALGLPLAVAVALVSLYILRRADL